jgi:hypothetical protein
MYTDDKIDAIEATGEAVKTSIPSDYTALEQATYNAYPTQSESGNPIYFDDGADSIPVKELIVNLEPKQSGSGDPSPSNVRPITVYDGVTVKRTGKNLLNLNRGLGTPNPSSGSNDVSPRVMDTEHYYVGIRNTNYYYPSNVPEYSITNESVSLKVSNNAYGVGFPVEVIGNTTYTVHGIASSNPLFGMAYYDSDWNYISSGGRNDQTYTFTTPSNAKYAVIILQCSQTNTTVTWTNLQLELGSTATDYEPYTEQEYSITFPSSVGTVYGGSLNVTTGVLTVDRFMTQLKWSDFTYKTVIGTYERRQKTLFSNDTIVYPPSANKPQISNVAPHNVNYQRDEFGFYCNSRQLTMLLPVGTSEDLIIQVICELRTPITYQLTPTEVSTLLGSNTISSDGSINLTYRADISKVIEKLTNAIISLGGNV